MTRKGKIFTEKQLKKIRSNAAKKYPTHSTCSIDGCELGIWAKGFCEKHYKQQYEQKRKIRLCIQAFEIYNNQCQLCGNRDLQVLQWHHKSGRDNKDERGIKVAKKIVEARERISNIMLLCANCHIKQDQLDGTSNRHSVAQTCCVNG